MIKIDNAFSATQLQDYIDCQRRFDLKYIKQQSWPAIPSEPISKFEEHIKRGNRFHYILNQYFSGLPIELVRNMDEDEKVLSWFDYFLTYINDFNFKATFSEFTLTSKLADKSLVAIYDLIAVNSDGTMLIFDWKTSSRAPRESILKSKIQSKLYPFILLENSKEFFGSKGSKPIEKTKMIYWFPEHPKNIIEFEYGENEHHETRVCLSGLIAEIINKPPNTDYPKTDNDFLCKFCQYRSLCDRGIVAGDYLDVGMQELDLDNISIDFDSIPEISPDL